MKFIPWYNEDLIMFLDSFLKRNMIVFEYNMGSSTLYFRNRAQIVYSVDYLKDRYNNFIKEAKIETDRLSLIEPVLKEESFPYSHESYGTTDKDFLYHNFVLPTVAKIILVAEFKSFSADKLI